MTQNEKAIIRQLLAAEERKLEYIRKVSEETVSLAGMIGAGDMDNLLTVIDRRQEQLDHMENTDAEIRRLLSELSPPGESLFRAVFEQVMRGEAAGEPLPPWADELCEILKKQKELLQSVMSAEGDNQAKVAGLLEDVRRQIDAVKKNQTLIKKYAPNEDLPVGSVLNKKE